MRKELPEIHLDFMTPSPRLPLLRSMVNYASGFLGLDNKQLLKIIRNREKTSTSDRLLNLASSLFGTSRDLENVGLVIKKIYGFENVVTAKDHFLESQKTARNLINYLVYMYGFDPDRFGLKDEVKIPDPSLKRMLTYMNPRPNHLIKDGTASRSRFEQLRELIICDLSLRSDVRTKHEEPASKISELQQRFNNELYEGKAGSGELVVFYHSSNEENGIDKISKKKFKGSKKKIEEMRVIKLKNREVHVQVDFDTKSGFKKITKLMGYFYEKGILKFDPFGVDVDGEPLLIDRQRFRVVVYGNDEEIASVHEKIAAFFENIKERPIHNDHGQNSTLKKRYVADYKGIPFEIIYYDEKGLINSKKHIGKIKKISIPIKIGDKEYNADFNIHGGSAHDLYEIRRSLPLIFLMFPYEIYGLPGQSEKEYINEIIETVEKRSKEVVHQLRGDSS